MSRNHLGLGDAVKILIDEADIKGMDELLDWTSYLVEVTPKPTRRARTKPKPRTKPKKIRQSAFNGT
jgi:hypothetical protein